MKPLRKIREASGLTQSEFASKLGLVQSRVSELEATERASADVVVRVLDEFPREMRQARVNAEALLRANRPATSRGRRR